MEIRSDEDISTKLKADIYAMVIKIKGNVAFLTHFGSLCKGTVRLAVDFQRTRQR